MVGTTKLFERNVLCADRAALARWAGEIRAGQSAYFCNVHMLMLSRSDKVLAEAMDSAEFVFPDGVPLAWLQRRLGRAEASVLRGYEAMEFICARAAKTGLSIGLLGASEDVLDALAARLKKRFPGLQVVFSFAPPILEQDAPADMELIADIQASAPDFLFVSLGCPKQEKWIFRHREYLDSGVLGVGAAFGWLAGTTPMPPGWMERSGLGWLYRLVREPRRMAKRYFLYNTRFVLASARLLLFRPK